MTTARDLALVAADPRDRTVVEQGDLSLALAGAELIDLLDAEALTLDGTLLVPAGPAGASGPGTIIVDRGGPARSLEFTAARDGEAVISFAASAPGVSWGRPGAESAVVSIAL